MDNQKNQVEQKEHKCINCNCMISANSSCEKCSCCQGKMCNNCSCGEGMSKKQFTCKNCCGTGHKHEEKSGLEMKEKEHTTGTTGQAKGTIEAK